jgi:hypothetical protein
MQRVIHWTCNKTVVKLETVMQEQVQDNDPRLKTENCTIADCKHLMKRKPTAYYLLNLFMLLIY